MFVQNLVLGIIFAVVFAIISVFVCEGLLGLPSFLSGIITTVVTIIGFIKGCKALDWS